MEKARDGSFVRTIRKTAEDDEEDWDGTLNRYRVSTLGTEHPWRRALTRRYFVVPCGKSTRSSGLEVL